MADGERVDARRAALEAAQARALTLFDAIEAGLVRGPIVGIS
jgi:hypothetical protein